MPYNNTQDFDEPFENAYDYNRPNYMTDDVRRALDITILVGSIIIFLLALCAIVTDILLIYVIVKFKRLKSTLNSYILHYAIINILFFVGIPILYLLHWIVADLLGLRFYSYIHLECLAMETDRLCTFLTFLFTFALSFDWFIMVFKPALGLKIKAGYKHFIIYLYVLAGVKFTVQIALCLTNHFKFESLILSVTYCVCLIFTLAMDYLNYRYKSSIRNVKTTYSLTIANIILLSSLPTFIYGVFYDTASFKIDLTFIIMEFIRPIPLAISFTTSIFVVVTLCKINKYFSMAFAKTFKRSVRDYSNEEETLDESEVNNSETNTSVTYNNNSTSINL